MKSLVTMYQSPTGLILAFSQASISFLWVPDWSARETKVACEASIFFSASAALHSVPPVRGSGGPCAEVQEYPEGVSDEVWKRQIENARKTVQNEYEEAQQTARELRDA